MNRVSRLLAATFLTASFMFSGVAQAMEIQKFDKMATPDQDEFVAELVIGAQKVLTEAGHPEQAAQVRKLFTEIKPGDQISDGMAEFEIILAKVRLADAQRLEKDPNARRLEVEDAMAITLKRNGVVVPDAFFTVAANFHPKLPPKDVVARNTDAPQPPQQ